MGSTTFLCKKQVVESRLFRSLPFSNLPSGPGLSVAHMAEKHLWFLLQVVHEGSGESSDLIILSFNDNLLLNLGMGGDLRHHRKDTTLPKKASSLP
jgi:hypothetical protein